MISYAAPVWSDCLGMVHIDRKLQSAQRRALIRICRAYSTAPTKALQLLAGKLPIQLTISLITQRWLIRDDQINSINGIPYDNIERTKKGVPSINPAYWPDIADQPWPIQHLTIFTDGSKNNTAVGCAFVVYANNEETFTYKTRLGETCSVFQAELWAILSAIRWCDSIYNRTEITIFTDSYSSTQAIHNFQWRSPIVHDILLELAKDINRYAIVWVRGHAGVSENERAKQLARMASELESEPSYNATPQCHILRQTKENTFAIWQRQWEEHSECLTKGVFSQGFRFYSSNH
ncbi:uncharacterized protein LOC111642338 [Centruroides sculpturatus]|uniref:uncharacterized protein LOC111642338 n=1 Tax=Centruroides sculpturatus TaxID=218467 RepID=UPI000C6D973D|nr:uncharacterized protein LOC111642338 [Centruroides sculpturatus]